MKRPSLQWSLTTAQLLLQLLLPSLASGDSSSGRLRFARAWLCPVESSGLRVQLLGDEMACALQCTGQPRCNAFHFQPSTGSCYLGDACAPVTQQQWTAGTCASFLIKEVTSGDSVYGSSTPLLGQLQMKLFYKFKKSGHVNEANPRQFCLTAHDVTVGSDGAEFKGNSGSYLSTETPGFEHLLDYGNTYSFFVQVRSLFLSNNKALASFVHCNGSLPGNQLLYCNGSLCQQSEWLQLGDGAASLVAQSVPAVPPLHTDQPALASLGVAVDMSAESHFYFNQSLLESSLHQVTAGSAEASQFQCLRLGYHLSSEGCFNGTIGCYGVSSRTLLLEEFQQLEAYCLEN